MDPSVLLSPPPLSPSLHSPNHGGGEEMDGLLSHPHSLDNNGEMETNFGEGDEGNTAVVVGDDSYDDGDYINHDGGLEDSVEMGQQGVEEEGARGEGGAGTGRSGLDAHAQGSTDGETTGQGQHQQSGNASGQRDQHQLQGATPSGNHSNSEDDVDDEMTGLPSTSDASTNAIDPSSLSAASPGNLMNGHGGSQQQQRTSPRLVANATNGTPGQASSGENGGLASIKQETWAAPLQNQAIAQSQSQPQERKPPTGLGVGQSQGPNQPISKQGQAAVNGESGSGSGSAFNASGAGGSGEVAAGAKGGRGRGSSAEAGPSRAETKRKPSAKKRGRDAKVETDNEDFLAAIDENDMPIPGTIFKNAFGPDDVDEMDDDDDDDDSPNERRTKKAKNAEDKSSGFVVDGDGDQARRKIRIEYIEDRSRRHITFSKRKAGIMKKAYELSTLTGTQLLLLVVSETGLVYTFSTDKLSPMVQKAEGVKMIQACLNTPDNAAEEEEEEPKEVKPKRKGKEKLAIRPLKLNDSAKANLANSASKAAAQNTDGVPNSPSPPPHPVEEPAATSSGPSLPSAIAARPKKRMPSGKSKKALAAAKKATEVEEAGNVPAVPDMPPFTGMTQQAQEHVQQPHSATSSHHDIGPHNGMMAPNMAMMSPMQPNFTNHISQHMAPEYHQHQAPPQQHPYYGGGHHPAQQQNVGMPTYGYAPQYSMSNTMPPNAMTQQNSHYGQHPMQGMHHYEQMQDHSNFNHHQGTDGHMNPQMSMAGQ